MISVNEINSKEVEGSSATINAPIIDESFYLVSDDGEFSLPIQNFLPGVTVLDLFNALYPKNYLRFSALFGKYRYSIGDDLCALFSLLLQVPMVDFINEHLNVYININGFNYQDQAGNNFLHLLVKLYNENPNRHSIIENILLRIDVLPDLINQCNNRKMYPLDGLIGEYKNRFAWRKIRWHHPAYRAEWAAKKNKFIPEILAEIDQPDVKLIQFLDFFADLYHQCLKDDDINADFDSVIFQRLMLMAARLINARDNGDFIFQSEILKMNSIAGNAPNVVISLFEKMSLGFMYGNGLGNRSIDFTEMDKVFLARFIFLCGTSSVNKEGDTILHEISRSGSLQLEKIKFIFEFLGYQEKFNEMLAAQNIENQTPFDLLLFSFKANSIESLQSSAACFQQFRHKWELNPDNAVLVETLRELATHLTGCKELAEKRFNDQLLIISSIERAKSDINLLKQKILEVIHQQEEKQASQQRSLHIVPVEEVVAMPRVHSKPHTNLRKQTLFASNSMASAPSLTSSAPQSKRSASIGYKRSRTEE